MSEEYNVENSEEEKLYGKRLVLAVDDNEINRELIRVLLEPYYEILLAENGQEALEILEEHYKELSVILLDIQMPVMNGYEFLRITRHNPLLEQVPIIVMTSNSGQEEEAKCLNLGASDFISKPYDPNIALRRIENIIRLRESAATLSAVEYDELTGLLTRQAFYHHAEMLLKKNPDTRYDLLISDIEDFRMINELYGEEMGDRVLCHIADFLRKGISSGILVGRYGADQFVSLAEHKAPTEISEEMYLMMYRKLCENSPLPHVVGKSGIYDNVDHNLPVSIICDRAISALRTVKHQYGVWFAKYDENLQQNIDRYHLIENSMQESLDHEDFKVYFQPKHDAKTGKLVGAEALVRWNHPKLGFISPADFIPQFEKNGFICQLDDYMWRQTCCLLSNWQHEGIKIVPVSVNASRRDFLMNNTLGHFMKPVLKYNLDKSYIHIEVTESFYQNSVEELIQSVRGIRELGFQIELDDFGSGYSSLGSLKELPIDIIKLDMSFVRNLEQKKEIIEVIVILAEKLGCKTVVEGVETEEQKKVIASLGCDYIQGYYYSRPLPAEEFRQYLIDHTT